MKNRWIRILLLLLAVILLLFFGEKAFAAEAGKTQEEIYDKSGAQELYDNLDEDARELLGSAQVQGASFDFTRDGTAFFESLSQTLRDKLTAPLRTAALLLAAIILCKLCSSLTSTGAESVISITSVLACAGILVPQMISLISQTKAVITGAAAFLVGCVPVYTGLLVAVGNGQTAVSTGYLTLLAGNAIPLLTTALFIPLLNIFLALSITAAVSDSGMEKFTDGIYRFIKWALLLIVTVFFAVMSLQTAIQSGMDSAAAKTAKMVVSSAIPVVGSAISDSLGAIQGSVALVKTGVGAFGILAALAIFLPLLVQTLLYTVLCWAAELSADLLEVPAVGKFAKAAGGVVKMIAAILASCFAVCLICASVLAMTRGSL